MNFEKNFIVTSPLNIEIMLYIQLLYLIYNFLPLNAIVEAYFPRREMMTDYQSNSIKMIMECPKTPHELVVINSLHFLNLI